MLVLYFSFFSFLERKSVSGSNTAQHGKQDVKKKDFVDSVF